MFFLPVDLNERPKWTAVGTVQISHLAATLCAEQSSVGRRHEREPKFGRAPWGNPSARVSHRGRGPEKGTRLTGVSPIIPLPGVLIDGITLKLEESALVLTTSAVHDE